MLRLWYRCYLLGPTVLGSIFIALGIWDLWISQSPTLIVAGVAALALSVAANLQHHREATESLSEADDP